MENSNKKRKEIEQKVIIDNNNNNNEDDDEEDDDDIITYKKFKNEIDFSIIKHIELQTIASSLGLIKKGSKKEIYNNIEKHLLNLESIKPIEIINPFNKQAPLLVIKDNIDPVEIPFWRVFRSKSIFIKIFSNFKNKRMYGYYDLQCNKEFFNKFSNSMEIIIDNIKQLNNSNSNNNNNNHHHHNIINDEQHIINIITSISKNNNETRSFYKLLFSKFDLMKSFYFGEVPHLIGDMIKKSNLVALEEYINYYNVQDKVKECLKYHSLYNENGYFNNNKRLKVINYLIQNQFISEELKNTNVYEVLLSNYIFLKESNVFNLNIKLKKVINRYNLLISIYQKFNQCITNLENRVKLDKLILELNEITSSGGLFTNDQLNSDVIQFLDNSTTKEIIYKYCEAITLFDNNELVKKELLPYHFLFKDKEFIYNEIKLKLKQSEIDIVCLINYFKLLFEITFRNNENDRMELITSLFDSNGLFTGWFDNDDLKNSMIEDCFEIIVNSNNVELIDFYIKQVEKYNSSINLYMFFNFINIKSKEVLDYYFKKYVSSTTSNGHQEVVINISNLDLPILEYLEHLLCVSNKKLVITTNVTLSILNIKISNPLLYTIPQIQPHIFQDVFSSMSKRNQLFTPLLFTLSNIQLKSSLFFNIDSMFYKINYNWGRYEKVRTMSSSNPILELLFDNISKEMIEISIKDQSSYQRRLLHLKSTPTSFNNNPKIDENELSSEFKFETFIISKPNSIPFNISIDNLFVGLYFLGRFDDIIYLFQRIPQILHLDKSGEDLFKWGFYNILSCYYLELLINHYIQNLNDVTINHLYECLCVASSKGYTSIFKSLISTDNYCDYLFKVRIRSKNNQSLFDSNLLAQLVKKSKNDELKNLLLKYINFSKKDLKSFKL